MDTISGYGCAADGTCGSAVVVRPMLTELAVWSRAKRSLGLRFRAKRASQGLPAKYRGATEAGLAKCAPVRGAAASSERSN